MFGISTVEIGHKTLMLGDFGIFANSDAYTSIRNSCIPPLVILCVGIPAYYLTTLFLLRKRKDEESVKRRWGLLYINKNNLHFTVIRNVIKIMMIVVSSLFYYDWFSRCIVILIVVVVYYIYIRFTKPFKDRTLTIL